jgi:carboxyl-terminal processing protease
MILVDRGTASASEVLAGALQDHGRAVLVGERTFGKGSVQSVLPLRNGGGIKLTTARYYTPSGRSIQAEGIRPDILYLSENNSSRGREVDLDRHLERELAAEGDALAETPEQDNFPLDEALTLLEAAGILSPTAEADEESTEETGHEPEADEDDAGEQP